MLQALTETVKSATWRMTMPNAAYSTTDVVPTVLTINTTASLLDV